MILPAAIARRVPGRPVVRVPGERAPARLLKLAWVAVLLCAPAVARAQDIAVYGAEVGGNAVRIYDQGGQLKSSALFETAPGSGVYALNTSIEDIACDAWGRVYAVGKPGASTLRAVYKSSIVPGRMDILFTSQTYASTVDGSIAVSPTGNVAIYGATDGVNNVWVFDQAGNTIATLLFQQAVNGGAWSVNTNIEDLAYDAAGNLYAVGKPTLDSLLAVYKSVPGGNMDILFQTNITYSAGVDGSIAVAPSGSISIHGAKTGGSSLRTYSPSGTQLNEKLFQHGVGASAWSISNTIEDIACDSEGTLYAVGKPLESTQRAIFKCATSMIMDIQFQTSGFTSTVDAGIVILPLTAWTLIAGGIAGSDGVPELEGLGTLAAGSGNQLRLSDGVPSSPALLFVGLTAVNLPFKGGVFIPAATLTLPLVTDSSGSVNLPFVMPAGLPAGTMLYLQCWQQDAAAIQGYTASNGLQGVAP